MFLISKTPLGTITPTYKAGKQHVSLCSRDLISSSWDLSEYLSHTHTHTDPQTQIQTVAEVCMQLCVQAAPTNTPLPAA